MSPWNGLVHLDNGLDHAGRNVQTLRLTAAGRVLAEQVEIVPGPDRAFQI